MGETVYYVCKYTPVELLAGFGLTPERLDPAPAGFECAETCAHPNLCGYGKAVLEEVVGKGIKSLVLVDCCDVCRRIYDVLEQCGDMEFLFLMSLPHKNGPAERALLARELLRLRDALAVYTGRAFDFPSAMDAWTEACAGKALSEPHIRLTGAHGGSLLLRAIRERSPLPVTDDTCTGNRRLPEPGPNMAEQTFFPPMPRRCWGRTAPVCGCSSGRKRTTPAQSA